MTTTTDQGTDPMVLRDKIARLNECALRARLDGELVEAAKLQKQCATIARWIKEVRA